MYCLSVAYWIFAVVLASLAVCWAYVLVQPDMLLCGLQRRVREWHKAWWIRKYDKVPEWQHAEAQQELERIYYMGHELDSRFWWHPVWGCSKCCAGQMAFWSYLLLFPLAHYNPLSHLGFAAVTIILSIIIQKWSQ